MELLFSLLYNINGTTFFSAFVAVHNSANCWKLYSSIAEYVFLVSSSRKLLEKRTFIVVSTLVPLIDVSLRYNDNNYCEICQCLFFCMELYQHLSEGENSAIHNQLVKTLTILCIENIQYFENMTHTIGIGNFSSVFAKNC